MRAFLNSNILVYAFGRDDRAEPARALLDQGGTIGVQCLNEFANVALNKLRMNWDEVELALETIIELCEVAAPIDLSLHRYGLAISRRYRLSIYDGLIIAAALHSDCDTLWSEDMQDSLVVENRLVVRNPFRL